MAALATIATIATPAVAAPFKIGQPAPDGEMTLIDGTKVRLSELKGEVVLLNFWATWCVPCRTELPLLESYYRAMSRHGLRVFAITTEGSVSISRLKPLFAAMTIPSVRRVRGIPIDVAAVPTNYIIDRAGIVRYAKAGALDIEAFNRLLVPLLNEGKD